MAILDVQHIEKSFGATKVLKDINFSLPEGQVLAIIGSSGSGKTTLLRCLNFLETPDKGSISVRGETLFPCVEQGLAPPPSGRVRFAESGSILAWCSRISTFFPSIRPWKMSPWPGN